jgi:hypothetical protein
MACGSSIAEFGTQLGRIFSLVGDWVVGVAEVSYTKSWYNVLFPHKIILFDEMGTVYNDGFTETNDIINISEELHVSSGYYESARKLVDEINSV